MNLTETTLEGPTLRLEPVRSDHAASLLAAASPEVFRYLLGTPDPWTEAGFRAYLERIPRLPDRLPFTIVIKEVGTAIGMTAYFDIRPEHRSLEIGHTWVAPAYQKTHVNPESKLILLTHAFEALGCVRVQLKTDGCNVQSQRAMIKLGLRYEGTLRKHMIRPDGVIRDTVMFSVTDDEWPDLKRRLEARISA